MSGRLEGAATEQVQQIKQSKFVCSACGSGRDCDCNAPALEREAARREAQRQADARYAERRKEKRQQKQQSVDIDKPLTPEEEAVYERARAIGYELMPVVGKGLRNKYALAEPVDVTSDRFDFLIFRNLAEVAASLEIITNNAGRLDQMEGEKPVLGRLEGPRDFVEALSYIGAFPSALTEKFFAEVDDAARKEIWYVADEWTKLADKLDRLTEPKQLPPPDDLSIPDYLRR